MIDEAQQLDMALMETYKSQEVQFMMLLVNDPEPCPLEDPNAPIVQQMPAKISDRYSRILQLSSARTSVTVIVNNDYYYALVTSNVVSASKQIIYLLKFRCQTCSKACRKL